MGWPKVSFETRTTSWHNVFLRTGFDDALNFFKADDALTIKAFPAQLRSMISLYSNVYIDLPQSPRKNVRSTKSLLRYLSPPVNPRSEYETVVESLSSSRRKPLAPHIAQLRAFKSVCEQQVMRMAADISGRSHAKVIGFLMHHLLFWHDNYSFLRQCALHDPASQKVH